MILFYGKYIAGEKKERDGVNKEVNDSDSDDSVTGNNQE
jgi:hypothetical protein